VSASAIAVVTLAFLSKKTISELSIPPQAERSLFSWSVFLLVIRTLRFAIFAYFLKQNLEVLSLASEGSLITRDC
jgi:hypothetical protein